MSSFSPFVIFSFHLFVGNFENLFKHSPQVALFKLHVSQKSGSAIIRVWLFNPHEYALIFSSVFVQRTIYLANQWKESFEKCFLLPFLNLNSFSTAPSEPLNKTFSLSLETNDGRDSNWIYLAPVSSIFRRNFLKLTLSVMKIFVALWDLPVHGTRPKPYNKEVF